MLLCFSQVFCYKQQMYKESWQPRGQKVLALVCFTLAVLEKPTDCPSQKIPSKRLLGWICVGEAKVDAEEISLCKVRGHSIMAWVCVIRRVSVNCPKDQNCDTSALISCQSTISQLCLCVCRRVSMHTFFLDIYSIDRWLCGVTPVRSVVWNMH